jgi:uncharacterized protein
VTRSYLDTSAALKLLVEEAESVALAAHLDAAETELVSCSLLETELLRAAHRLPGLVATRIASVLEGISLFTPRAHWYRRAGALPGTHLRALDALHLAAALETGCLDVVTYDHRMAEAAATLGLAVVAPA